MKVLAIIIPTRIIIIVEWLKCFTWKYLGISEIYRNGSQNLRKALILAELLNSSSSLCAPPLDFTSRTALGEMDTWSTCPSF